MASKRIVWHADTHTNELYTDYLPLAGSTIGSKCYAAVKPTKSAFRWWVYTGSSERYSDFANTELSAKREAARRLRECAGGDQHGN